jgi:hypothetical protein
MYSHLDTPPPKGVGPFVEKLTAAHGGQKYAHGGGVPAAAMENCIVQGDQSVGTHII